MIIQGNFRNFKKRLTTDVIYLALFWYIAGINIWYLWLIIYSFIWYSPKYFSCVNILFYRRFHVGTMANCSRYSDKGYSLRYLSKYRMQWFKAKWTIEILIGTQEEFIFDHNFFMTERLLKDLHTEANI